MTLFYGVLRGPSNTELSYTWGAVTHDVIIYNINVHCVTMLTIDGVRFWVIFVVPGAAVSRHGMYYFSHLYCAIYTYDMPAATINIDNT